MSVLLETSLGDLVIDLLCEEAPLACFNFLRLCMSKKMNNRLVIEVQKDHIARITSENVGDDWSVYKTKFFKSEISRRKFDRRGIVAMANTGPDQNASNFFITLMNQKIDSFYKKHTIIGFVAEEESGSVLDKINQVAVNCNFRPLQNIRIKHTVVIDDPFEGKEIDF